jgi:hypothetical protein
MPEGLGSDRNAASKIRPGIHRHYTFPSKFVVGPLRVKTGNTLIEQKISA